jgi:hypothetical protein
LSYANFEGPIPEELVTIPPLISLYLDGNHLNGSLPVALATNLNATLVYLSLSQNDLTGSVSPDILAIPQLQILDVYHNMFQGSLPFMEGLIAENLVYLDLSYNSFTGQLPSNWTSYLSLRYLYANSNPLTGTFPAVYLTGPDKAASVSLFQLDLRDTLLYGTLSEALWTHTAMQELLLANNNFYGTLSSGLMNMTSMLNLDLSSNNFGANLNNVFTSPLPLLSVINLANNSFTGNIPGAIASPALTIMALSSNCFSGSVPESICQSSALQTLLLNTLSTENNCAARVPSALRFAFKGLFPNKKMDGSIPSCLFGMGNLTTLQLSGNKLSGQIPNMTFSASIQNLELSFNELTGPIPMFIQTSGQFGSLSLQNNKLSGTLISDFAVSNHNNPSSNISLTVNRLSGNIPRTFFDLPNLSLLTGNLLDCRWSDPLPAYDPSRSTYTCGSNQFDVAMWLWFACLLVAITASLLLYYLIRNRVQTADPTGKGDKGNNITAANNVNESSLEMRSSMNGSGTLNKALLERAANALLSIDSEPTRTVESSNTVSIELIGSFVASAQYWLSFDFEGKNLLSSTSKFCNGLVLVCRGLALWAVVYLGCMLFYIALKLGFSNEFRTVTVQDLWTTTSLFLHGYVPAVVLLIVVLAGITALFFRLNPQRRILKEELKAEQRYSTIWKKYSWGTFDYVCIPVLAHTINLVVAVITNAVYVTYLPSIPHDYTLFFQATMSITKTAWVNFYVPLAMRRLYYLSTSSRFQTQVAMLLVNYLVGPGLASAGANKNCLYYVFKGSPQVTSLFSFAISACYAMVGLTINYNTGEILYDTTTVCNPNLAMELDTVYTTPPFIYTYQCGFSFLVDYIPVLLYSYLLAAAVHPICRLCALYCSQPYLKRRLGKTLYNWLISDTIYDYEGCADELKSVRRVSLTASMNVPMSRANSVASDTTEIAEQYIVPLFDGSFVIAKRLVDVAVMMTFGLACPLLACTIAISVVVQSVVWRLTIGKFLCTVGVENTLAMSRLERSFGDGVTHGTIGGLRVVLLAVSWFWAIMFFDMIGDQYDSANGVVFAAVSFVFVPMYAFLFFHVKAWFGEIRVPKNGSPSRSGLQESIDSPFGLKVPLTGGIHGNWSNSEFKA